MANGKAVKETNSRPGRLLVADIPKNTHTLIQIQYTRP